MSNSQKEQKEQKTTRRDNAVKAITSTPGQQRILALQSYMETYGHTIAGTRTLIYAAILNLSVVEAESFCLDAMQAGIPFDALHDLAHESLVGPDDGEPLRNPQGRQTAHAIKEAIRYQVLQQDLQNLYSHDTQTVLRPEEVLEFAYKHTDLDSKLEEIGDGMELGMALVDYAEYGPSDQNQKHVLQVANAVIDALPYPAELAGVIQYRKTSDEQPNGLPYLSLQFESVTQA